MKDGFLASTPEAEWPMWAQDLASKGTIIRRGAATYVHNGHYPVRCRPGDYICPRLGTYPVIISCSIYEGLKL